MADFQTIVNCVTDFIAVTERPEYWDGILRRLTSGAPLTVHERYSLNELVRDWTEYHSYNYETTRLITQYK